MAALLAGAGVALALVALPGLAQPDRAPRPRAGEPSQQPADRPPPGGNGRPPERQGDLPPGREVSAADLRARLVNRLGDARTIEARLEKAIADLDAGRSPSDVMSELWTPGMMRPERGFDGPRPGPEDRGPMDEAERQRLLSALRERMPRVAEWVSQLERDDPRMMELVRGRLLPRLREIEEMRRHDTPAADARTIELAASIGVMRTTRDYRQAVAREGADSPAAGGARDALRAALVAQFDARLAVTQHEIDALGRRIEALRTDARSQAESRDAMIESALERITQDALRPQPAEGQSPMRPGR